MPSLKIFISYRREASGGYASRLHERVLADFGAENVFMDVDSVQAGEDYVEIIEDQVGACDVLLAVTVRGGSRRPIGRATILPTSCALRWERPSIARFT